MQYRLNLKANQPTRQSLQGTTFLIVDTGAAPDLDLKIDLEGFASEEMRTVRRGFRLRGARFSSCLVTAPVDCTIEIIASFADINISIDYAAGSNVNANIVGTPTVLIGSQPVNVTVGNAAPVNVAISGGPLAVVPDRGAPANPVYVSGITYADAPAVTLQDNAAVAVTSAGAALVAANAARRGLRITNIGLDPVAIGFTGITWAKRCLILDAGDTWFEDRAANLAWSAITDTGNASSVTTQEVLA